MKKILFCLFLVPLFHASFAQDESREDMRGSKKDTEQHGFDKSKIHFGSGLSLGFSSGYDINGTQSNIFNIGLLPEVGYDLFSFLEGGIGGNINYTSYSYPQYSSQKTHVTSYGIGPYVRIKPIEQLFIQLMPEHDWQKSTTTTSGYTYKLNIQSQSFLAGIGYKYSLGDDFFACATLMIDLDKDPYSPYKTYNSANQLISVPIYRVSFNYYPFRK